MKKIKTSDIIVGSAMPLKSGSLDHLQSAYGELLFGLAQSQLFQRTGVVAGYVTPQALYGCGYGVLGTIWTIESGLIAFGSELFIAPTVGGINLSVGEVVVGTITTTYLTAANADPVVFSDATSNNVHEIRQIVWSAGVSGSADLDFLDIQYMGRWLEQTYSAGDLTAATGNWTIPGGAADFKVKTQRRGSTMVVDFSIVSSSIGSATAYITLNLASTDKIKGNFHAVGFYANGNQTPTEGMMKIVAVDGSRELRMYQIDGSNWAPDIITIDVSGQITVEMDCNES
jgi:hypothetical protein